MVGVRVRDRVKVEIKVRARVRVKVRVWVRFKVKVRIRGRVRARVKVRVRVRDNPQLPELFSLPIKDTGRCDCVYTSFVNVLYPANYGHYTPQNITTSGSYTIGCYIGGWHSDLKGQ